MFLVARVRSDFGPRPHGDDGDHGSKSPETSARSIVARWIVTSTSALAIASAALRESLRRARRSNSALEMAPHDPELQRVVAEVLVRVEGFFRRCAAAGQKNRTIQRRKPPRIWLASC